MELSKQGSLEKLPAIQSYLDVQVKQIMLSGINAYEVIPNSGVSPENKDKIIIYFHGGGYVYNPGIAGTLEAMQLSSAGKYKVISVFGTSAGGGLTLALMLKAKAENLPLPAAIGLGTPWVNLTDNAGDTEKTLEWVDNTLISSNGYIKRSAKLYANGESLTNPYISPIFGDFKDMPPAIIISGTRDLFLSQSVLTHRKLRNAGVKADLQVWEGMSHAQYEAYNTPEAKEVFTEMSNFFKENMK